MIRKVQSESATVVLYEDEYSRRIRVEEYSGTPHDVLRLILDSTRPWTEKLIIKSKPHDVRFFTQNGFTEEATIVGYFSGVTMHFLTKYLLASRSQSNKTREEDDIIRTLLANPPYPESASTARVEFASASDAGELARLYGASFKVYPTPVNNPDHVLKTMKDGTVYMVVRDNGKIISAASAEINETYHNAELTDCVTAAGHEGKGLMRAILLELERHLHARRISCLYTIARSESFGMNKVFHQLGYTYSGRMTKNCMIFSGVEDMNVWYKFENSVI
jgi:putative beta-lysine N-acetyltransferase